MKNRSKPAVYQIVFSSTEQSPIAYAGGRAIALATFKSDVTKLQALLQENQVRKTLITTSGRYAFSVALLASWLAEARVILPPDQHAMSIEKIRIEHAPGFECNARWGKQLLARQSARQPESGQPHGVWKVDFAANLEAVLLYTSGSTGAPVIARKTVGNLLEEANYIYTRFDWPDAAIVGTVPAQHLYGLTFSMMLPWVSGLPWVDEVPLYPRDITKALAQCDAGTLISVPAHYKALIEEGAVPRGLVCVSAAAPLATSTARDWQKKYGRHILEIYGSTETGVVAHRHQLQDENWQVFAPVKLALVAGLLNVSSPFVREQSGGGFQTADRAVLEGDQFQLLGRSDAIVKIGGKRISLRVIEQALVSCNGVKDAVVIAVDVQSMVRDKAIWAVVEADKTSQLNANILRAMLRQTLDGVSIPRRIAIVDNLPRNASGKHSRQLVLASFENVGA